VRLRAMRYCAASSVAACTADKRRCCRKTPFHSPGRRVTSRLSRRRLHDASRSVWDCYHRDRHLLLHTRGDHHHAWGHNPASATANSFQRAELNHLQSANTHDRITVTYPSLRTIITVGDSGQDARDGSLDAAQQQHASVRGVQQQLLLLLRRRVVHSVCADTTAQGSGEREWPTVAVGQYAPVARG
jgi:hypothetical protein